MKVMLSSPNYPEDVAYPEDVIRWVVRLVAGKSTMEDAVAAQEALAQSPALPLSVAVQATFDVVAGIVDPEVMDTVFKVDLDEDGKADLTITEVGDFVRYVTGKQRGLLKKESETYQAIVKQMAAMLD